MCDLELNLNRSEKFKKIFTYISELVNNDSSITPSNIYKKLVDDKLINPNSGLYHISFTEARELDLYFFGTDGNYWLDTYLRPSEGEIFMFSDGHERIAFRCGIFTFNYEYTDQEYENENKDDYNYNYDYVYEIYNEDEDED